MKTHILSVLFGALPLAAIADINVPGANGTDGVLNITANTVIDLSLAPDGTWDQDNSANASKGVFDPEKWAVVFKYSSVNIANGATVTFKNHASRAPVVWLVSGDVTIAGAVSLDGQSAIGSPNLSEPGPGGFRGATAYFSAGVDRSAGFGVGGGFHTQGGTYGSSGGNSSNAPYGNPSLIPLLGGSGGSVYRGWLGGGGAGAGALLIASSGTVNISGSLRGNGGNGANYWNNGDQQSYGGSGGAIRIICDTLQGNGSLNATGGGGYGSGGLGRIRLERVTNTNTLQVVPDPSVVPLATGATALIWPPADAPEVKVISIGGETAPADPRASFGSAGADVALAQTASTPVIIETRNVEQAAQVQVRVTPRSNANATVVNATVSSVVSTSPLVVRWTAALPVNVGYSAVQVKVVRP